LSYGGINQDGICKEIITKKSPSVVET